MQIVAQCEEHTEIRVAVETLKPSALIVSLPILCDHPDLLHPLKEAAIGVIAVAPTPEQIPTEIAKHLHGTISRDISVDDLVHSVRHVSRGHRDSQSLVHSAIAPVKSDLMGKCVRNRLTRRELQVVGLIAKAYKNKEIADCLGTKEQVVKNYVSNPASSSSGRFGSGIDLLAEQFDREVSFSRSPAANRIAECEHAVEFGISQRGLGRSLVQWRKRDAPYFSFDIRPDFRRIAIIQKA
jgi:DNA-binding NarL/FixJ family response regulator